MRPFDTSTATDTESGRTSVSLPLGFASAGHPLQVRSPHWLVLAVVPSLLLTGCGGSDSASQLTVRARVNVCRTADRCVMVPAAGARVRVVDSAGAVVLDDALQEDGTATAAVDPGQFVVKVSFLNLATNHMDVTVRDDDVVEASLNLPRVTASK